MKKPIKVSSRKGKGRACQKWAAQRIGELIGLPHGKDCPVEPRGMGQTGVDVRLDVEARARFPFSVECKWQESWSVPAWIEQAEANEAPGTDWLLIIKRSREPYRVVMDGEAFFRLLKEKEKRENGNQEGSQEEHD